MGIVLGDSFESRAKPEPGALALPCRSASHVSGARLHQRGVQFVELPAHRFDLLAQRFHFALQ